MSLLRAVDDISPGDWLTRWSDSASKRKRVQVHIDEDGDVIRHVAGSEPVRMPGIPLKVLGVSLPYIVCGVLMPGGALEGPEVLDVRRESFMRLDDSYVQAIIDFPADSGVGRNEAEVETDDPPF